MFVLIKHQSFKFEKSNFDFLTKRGVLTVGDCHRQERDGHREEEVGQQAPREEGQAKAAARTVLLRARARALRD